MNFEEFKNIIKEKIKEYLPGRYSDAVITFNEVVKNNDNRYTGMCIARPNDDAVPAIYIDSYYKDHADGRTLESILDEIAFIRVEYENEGNLFVQAEKCLTDYEFAKTRLAIHLCECESNKDRMEAMVHRRFGDFAALYYVKINEDDDHMFGAGVNDMILAEWGVSKEQLHEDAMKAELEKGALFCKMNAVRNGVKNKRTVNLLDRDMKFTGNDGKTLYFLTSKNRRHGASLIIHDEILRKIGDLLDDDYFILPSSVHEVVVVPVKFRMPPEKLSKIVKEINEKEVSEEDRLSNKVQFYDRELGKLVNAMLSDKAKSGEDCIREIKEKYYS